MISFFGPELDELDLQEFRGTEEWRFLVEDSNYELEFLEDEADEAVQSVGPRPDLVSLLRSFQPGLAEQVAWAILLALPPVPIPKPNLCMTIEVQASPGSPLWIKAEGMEEDVSTFGFSLDVSAPRTLSIKIEEENLIRWISIRNPPQYLNRERVQQILSVLGLLQSSSLEEIHGCVATWDEQEQRLCAFQ